MADVLRPDICVIGAGSAGLAVAGAVAALGVPVVLVEKGKFGGACPNRGGMAGKALAAAAKRISEIENAALFGIATQPAKLKFPDVRRYIQEVAAALAPNDSKERFIALGVRVIEGAARFEARDTLGILGKDIKVRARRFVIATGACPAIPPIDGLDGFPYLTCESAFDLSTCPKHLIVVGAGSVWLELAQAFRRLGAQVTVLWTVPPLPDEDPECVDVVLQQFAGEEIAIHAGVAIKQIKRLRGKVRVAFADTEQKDTAIEGSHLLIASGRTPNIGDLGLEAAGVAHTVDGIVVNKALKTTNKRIYAVGDVAGGPPLANVASYHAELVVKNALFRLPVRVNDNEVPRVTYTDPELAHVGLTEADVRRRGQALRILRWPFQDNDRAQMNHRERGHIKVITTRRGRILGATIVGNDAGELITPWTLAIRNRLNIRAFADLVVPYPSLADVGRRAAISYYRPSLTSPVLRRIIGLLRRFG
jgi:pyruvate/2-oxoglutarate dehydrogenase complex dihydrolipoamide dehydrogenase (E3) component